MTKRVTLSEDLTDTQWMCELEELAEEAGYFAPLGDHHAAAFFDESQDVLFVAFETQAGIRTISETGMPMAYDLCESRNWSHLTLVATRDSWFRSPHIYGYFDRLVDEGFFEDFDHVIFYGAGMCGYAAAAYSVVAPGATVIAVSPQATLEPRRTEWDDRFDHMKGVDFTRRYGYAPDMLEAAGSAFVIYDPGEELDAMHATLFDRPPVTRIRYRRGGSGAIDSDLRALGILGAFADKAAAGQLDALAIHQALRARRRHIPYLRALLARVLAKDRPWLTALLCQSILRKQPIPRFRHFLEAAEARLIAEGRSLPGENDMVGAEGDRA